MNILDAVVNARDGAAIDQLAQQFGLKPHQASAAVAELMPALAQGFQRNLSSPTGEKALVSALSEGRHETYLDSPDTLAQPATTADGNRILGHLLGSKETSRAVAARAGEKTGIDPEVLKQMLPLVAALAMGGLSRQSNAGAGTDAKTAGAGLASMIGPLLDRDGDGSMMDDVAGMVGGLIGSRKRR